MTTPKTITDLLAARGLVPAQITLVAMDEAQIAAVRRAWDGYRDRAGELGWSAAYVAGLAAACADILRCQRDERFVREMAPLIDAEGLTLAAITDRATLLLSYFMAARPALAA